jgi:Protein of unknown function (DUF3892)
VSEYLITCVTKSAPTAAGHQHIVSVGIGGQKCTVADIYRFIDQGHTFRTASPSSGKEAAVAKYRCACGLATLRSHADGYWDNNLDNLPKCP